MNMKQRFKMPVCIILIALLVTGCIGGSAVFAAEEAPADAVTDLDAFISGWGESVAGVLPKDYRETFDEYEKGADFAEIEALGEYWIIGNATGDHITRVNESKGNKFLKFAPFGQMYLFDGITNKYVFSYDVRQPANQAMGGFFRSSGEVNINPYYEDDRSGFEIMGIGPSGIFLIPHETSVKIYVKYYDESKSADREGKYVNNKLFTIKTEENFTKDFVNVAVADYGTGAKIFINGKLLCTFEFSDIVSGYEELLSECSYYSRVKLTDAGGSELGEVSDALVCADFSVLAFGMRINEGYIDNISVSEYEDPVEKIEIEGTPRSEYAVGDKFESSGAKLVVTFGNGTTKKIDITEDMLEGFDTSSEGQIKYSVNYKGQKVELSAGVSAEKPTEEPPATADATAAATDKPAGDDSNGEKKSQNMPLIVGLIIGAVLIVAIIAVLLITKLRKKS